MNDELYAARCKYNRLSEGGCVCQGGCVRQGSCVCQRGCLLVSVRLAWNSVAPGVYSVASIVYTSELSVNIRTDTLFI